MKLKELINEGLPVNEYPDEIKKEVARKGAEIADRMYMAGRRWDDSDSKQVDLQVMRSQGRKFVSKGGPKVLDALSKVNAEHTANGKEWDKVRSEAETFKKENGFSVVYAWEALSQKSWPYYKIRSGAGDKNGSKVKLVEAKTSGRRFEFDVAGLEDAQPDPDACSEYIVKLLKKSKIKADVEPAFGYDPEDDDFHLEYVERFIVYLDNPITLAQMEDALTDFDGTYYGFEDAYDKLRIKG